MKHDNKLQILRNALGYTQERFAHELGVRREQIAAYEIGERRPGVRFFFFFKAKFNLSYEWIGEFACESAKENDACKKD